MRCYGNNTPYELSRKVRSEQCGAYHLVACALQDDRISSCTPLSETIRLWVCNTERHTQNSEQWIVAVNARIAIDCQNATLERPVPKIGEA